MPTDALIPKIRTIEVLDDWAGLAFVVQEVMELAVGVVAVRDHNHAFRIYFNHSDCQVWAGSLFRDDSVYFAQHGIGFPAQTGMIRNYKANSWACIMETASNSLVTRVGSDVAGHKIPVHLAYHG